MPAYHQMGHHSKNLVDLPDLGMFEGAIYSPINCDEASAIAQIKESKADRADFRAILDPQLYVPTVDKGLLGGWAYYPSDVDSADTTGLSWWKPINRKLAKCAERIGVDALCSPIRIPKLFDDKYYSLAVQIADDLLNQAGKPVMLTLIVSLNELSNPDRASYIASLASGFKGGGVYLALLGDTAPRRELSDGSALAGAMRLISELEQSDVRVLTGFSSSEMVLWKYAGATSCATGKFFNLRRFTRGRFEEAEEGGGSQAEYWFEEGLLAFLRQPDLLRLKKTLPDIFSDSSRSNPFSSEILANLESPKPQRWLSFGWRQFLYWFADAENRLTTDRELSATIVGTADSRWGLISKNKVFMIERENNGEWLREWLNALSEFDR